MIALLQRVQRAHVEIEGNVIASINAGLLVLLGVQQGDSEKQADRLLEKVLGYRVFADNAGRMNLDVRQAGGGVLLVPQFTLAADTGSGLRPGFSVAASPAAGERLFEYFAGKLQAGYSPVGCGRFGADMQVSLVNEGPVTFWLEVNPGV